jgi:hypothetical protein
VSVIVPALVPVTVAAEASRLSILTSWTIVPATDRSTWVSVPNDPSNLGRVTVEVQSVVTRGMVSHNESVLNGVAVAVGVIVLVGVLVGVGARVGVSVRVGVIVAVGVEVGV